MRHRLQHIRHIDLVSARMMRTSNASVSLGVILQDTSDDPLTDEDFREFFHEFFRWAYESDPG